MTDNKFEYIVCGAGIAGLYTALTLHEDYGIPANKIIIFEKSNRIGGRIYTDKIEIPSFDKKEYLIYERGATRFKKENHILMKLIRKYNLENNAVKISNEKDFKIIFSTGPEFINIKNIDNLLDFVVNKDYNKTELLNLTFRELCNKTIGFEKAKILCDYCGYDMKFDTFNAYDAIRYFKNNFNNRIDYYYLKDGMGQIVEKMVQDCNKKNINIKTNTKITNYSFQNNLFTVETLSWNELEYKKYYCDKLILALDKKALSYIPQLVDIKNLINSVNSCRLMKIFIIFPKNPVTNKVWFSGIPKTITNLPLRQIIPLDEEKGLILISYSDEQFAEQWQQYSINQKLEKNIMNYIYQTFPDFSIPSPLLIKAVYWDSGTHGWKVNSISDEYYKRIMKPFVYPLFICGEAYSLHQGWIEGALETSQQVCKLSLNLDNQFNNPKIFTIEEVSKSNNLTIINNRVYDLTKNDWINKHPGGEVIKKAIGKDGTELFKYIQHPEYAKNILEELYVGIIKNTGFNEEKNTSFNEEKNTGFNEEKNTSFNEEKNYKTNNLQGGYKNKSFQKIFFD